jgi:hypothetical protein
LRAIVAVVTNPVAIAIATRLLCVEHRLAGVVQRLLQRPRIDRRLLASIQLTGRPAGV